MGRLESPYRELLEAARAIIKERFKEGAHHVGAALRTGSGQVFQAVHLESNIGGANVCAEAVALGMAAAAGDTRIEAIVAVNRHGDVVSPCGICRELISDYSPAARVIVPSTTDGEPEIVSIADLLPNKYHKRF